MSGRWFVGAGLEMTTKDWQKKRKKMSGRVGPKKGKNR
jgi:hypothetical protein